MPIRNVFLSLFLASAVFAQGTKPDNPAFEGLIDRYLADFRGVGVSSLGPFDGSADYYSRALASAKTLLKEVEGTAPEGLSFDQKLDRRYLIGLLRTRVLDGEEVRRWQQDPRTYLDVTPVITTRGGLLNDELRPLAERATRIREIMRLVPLRLENAKKNLVQYIPLWSEPSKAVVEADIEIFEMDLPRFAARIPAQEAALLAEAAKVTSALKDFLGFLNNELPKRPQGDWRVGEKVFNFRLKNEHLIDEIDAAEFYAWGRREYAEQLRVLEHAAKVADPRRSWQQIELDLQQDHPSAEALIYEHLKVVRRTRDWVVKNDLFSVPWDEEGSQLATAAPAVYGKQQWYGFGGAPVGRGSKAAGGWTLVPPDPRWNPERMQEFLQGHSYAMINAMAPHEVYPGHGLIQLYLNHNPRKLRTFVSSYSNQAWSYYIEWVLVPEFGFYPPDKQKEYTVEMERNKLWRYGRVIYDAGMHTGRVPFEEGVHLMNAGVLFAERFAKIEVEETTRGGSGTSIPTWGYHQFLQLRDDYFARMAAMGRKGTLKDFHDRVMKIGMIPVSLIREALFAELEGKR